MKEKDRDFIEIRLRSEFADSLNLDAALEAELTTANRWDYLLGHRPSQKVVALEPHSGKSDEVSVVIAKHEAARQQLQAHLQPQATIVDWLWVSPQVRFADTESVRRRLDQRGIRFVGTRVLRKHLPLAIK